MVKYCVAYGCKETYMKGSNVSFHSFPADNKRKTLWINALRRENFIPSKHSRICSKHFLPEGFDTGAFGTQTKLKTDAVPSVFNFPQHLQPKTKKRKPPTERMPLEAHASTSSTSAGRIMGNDGNEPPPKRHKPFRKSFVGDYSEEMAKSPRKSLAFMQAARKRLDDTKMKLKMAKQTLRRTTQRLDSAETLLEHLKQKQMISKNAALALEKTLPPAAVQLLLRCKEGLTRKEYPTELRKFALTLQFYSTKAYNYIRDMFPHSLPHPSTLRRWYQSVDGKPGFNAEAKISLILKREDMAARGKPVVCSLLMDEMAIRKQVEYDGTKFVGFVDYGIENDDDDLPEAKEALVFMLVALNDHWKIPIGYFLIDSLNGTDRCNLVLQCLNYISELNIHVLSLTFDGLSANQSIARSLGANLCPETLCHGL